MLIREERLLELREILREMTVSELAKGYEGWLTVKQIDVWVAYAHPLFWRKGKGKSLKRDGGKPTIGKHKDLLAFMLNVLKRNGLIEHNRNYHIWRFPLDTLQIPETVNTS